MSGLDIFALIVLVVLVLAGVAVWAILGMLPGRIAHARNHPQAEAINVCGWWGVLTMGLLMPLAFIWAYTNPAAATVTSARRASPPGDAQEDAP
jgi:hypothetical protein